MKKYVTITAFVPFSSMAQNVVINLQNNTSEILMPLFNRLTLGLIGCAIILGASAIVCARILRK